MQDNNVDRRNRTILIGAVVAVSVCAVCACVALVAFQIFGSDNGLSEKAARETLATGSMDPDDIEIVKIVQCTDFQNRSIDRWRVRYKVKGDDEIKTTDLVKEDGKLRRSSMFDLESYGPCD